jgi:putative transposase
MLDAVALGFGEVLHLPHAVEWLSHNGPAFISTDTRLFAETIGLTVCTPPYYSPQSNGMTEAFVKTFKRDFVYANRFYDARIVLAQLPKWFEDYIENHLHMTLKMMSPRQVKRRTAKLGKCPCN